MPLKHHTETAYILLLALITSAYGVLLSLLPHFPQGVFYWSVLMLVSLAYPLVLWRTFRSNRADYEFRFLHWAPALMTVLWLVLELLASRFTPALILQLGFLYLWSLPLVVLALTMIILFCLHVIRRQTVRVAVVGGLLVAFFALSVSAEAFGWNEPMAAAFFPETGVSRMAAGQYNRLVANIGGTTTSSSSSVAVASSASRSSLSSSRRIAVASSARSVSSSSSSARMVAVASSSSVRRSSSSSSVRSSASSVRSSSSSVTVVAVASSASSLRSSSSSVRSSVSSSSSRSSASSVRSSSSSSVRSSVSSVRSSLSSSATVVAVASSVRSSSSSSRSIAPTSSVGSAASRALISSASISSGGNVHTPPTPSQLPSSGPEGFAVVFVTLLAVYCRMLHVRAVRRLDVE